MRYFIKKSLHFLLSAMLLLAGSLHAQRIAFESSIELPLSDGMNLICYKSYEGDKYFYLPPSQSIRLGRKDDPAKTPEFLFMKFTTEEREDQGGAQGAILHFLVEWGLTVDQAKEAQQVLVQKTKNPKALLSGPVALTSTPGESFKIISAILLDKKMTSSFITSGYAPPMPGNKAAVAARLDKHGAQLLDATFKKSRSISDVTIVFDYEYTVLVKAAKGKLTYKLDITHTQGDGIAYDLLKKELDKQPDLYDQALADYEKNKKKMTDECGVGDGMANIMIAMQAIDNAAGNTSGSGDTGSPWEYGISENMMRKVYDHFISTENIKLEWEENIDDERIKTIRDAFFNYFLSAFTEPSLPEPTSLQDLQTDLKMGDEAIKNSAQGGYKFKSCTQSEMTRSLNKTVRLDNIILPVKKRYQMVSNLASTYDQVKNNKNCVISVNLNDKFFQHRDINFILDVEAMELFEKELNYVTVNVRKKRSTGNSFEEALTISPTAMATKGRLAALTYARGEDKNSDVYEYKSQWSLRGGKVYPESPQWEKGDWQAVTLAPPIKPRTIEFEADLEELKAQGITRATLQVRYYKYGEEIETNIPITVSKNEPLTQATIFTDRDQGGYAYRLILTHKTLGKMALDWDAKINDDYVYASIPEKFKNGDKDFIEKIKKAAEVLLEPGPQGEVKLEDRILGKFKEVLKIFIDGK